MATIEIQDARFLLPRLRRYARVLTADRRRADQLVLDTLSHVPATGSEPAARPELRRRLLSVMHRLHCEPRYPRREQAPLRLVGEPQRALPDALSDQSADETLSRLARLPVEQREVLVLVVLEGLPYTEIASVLDIPIATVMSRLCDAREAMRSMEVVAREGLEPPTKGL